MHPDDSDEIVLGLDQLAYQVKTTWLASDYPEDVRSDKAQFRHALLHVMKAAGKIAAYADHREHQKQDAEAVAAEEELPKLFADLIRCTAKMAEMADVNLAQAYFDRAEQLAKRWGHGDQQPG